MITIFNVYIINYLNIANVIMSLSIANPFYSTVG